MAVMGHEKICREIERETRHQMQTPSDFEWLEEHVWARTKETVSASTLMRLWGYRKGVAPRRSTLDVLARYLGYADYITFCNWAPASSDEPQSDEVVARHLRTEELEPGARVELTWHPDRRCVVRLEKDGIFKVLTAENTKLSVDDTFECSLIVEGEPLYMSRLVHEGRPPMVYVAGKVDGVHFSYLADGEE